MLEVEVGVGLVGAFGLPGTRHPDQKRLSEIQGRFYRMREYRRA